MSSISYTSVTGGQTLQTVTLAGNTTTVPMYGSGLGLSAIFTTTNYLVLDTDYGVYCDVTGGSIIVTLPGGANVVKQLFAIKLLAPAAGNTVLIDVGGGGIIEGAVNYTLTANDEAITVQCVAVGVYMIVPTSTGGGGGSTTTGGVAVDATFTGFVFEINHGLPGIPDTWYALPFNANAALALSSAGQGYRITAGGAKLFITFNVAFAVATNLQFVWGATRI